jgi:Bacterial type II/III secretion system short domain
MRVSRWTNRAVIAVACVWIAPRLAVARPWRPPVRQHTPAVAASRLRPRSGLLDKPAPVAPAASKSAPAAREAYRKTGSEKAAVPPVTLTVVGDQLVIAGGDPKAVALADELAHFILSGKGEAYRTYHLQFADATEVAQVLNEWFNGPPKSQRPQPVRQPSAVPSGRGGRGGSGTPTPEPPPAPPRIHIVAEQTSNSLLVRGNILDLIAVQRLLDTGIDVEPGESGAAMKPFIIGPLQSAVATEVVRMLKEVFREDTNQSRPAGPGRLGLLRQRSQPLDATGRPKPVELSITADDRTNCVVGLAPATMAEDIKKVVGLIEEKSHGDTKSVRLVNAGGIDPTLLQEVMDAMQTRPTPPPRSGVPGQQPMTGGSTRPQQSGSGRR